MGKETPQVPMDPPPFMLAPLSMIDDEYELWRNGIPYAQWLFGNFDYDKFSEARLMAPFPIRVSTFLSSISLSFYLAFLACDNTQMW